MWNSLYKGSLCQGLSVHSEPFFFFTDSYQIPKNERFSFILRLMTSTKSLTFLYHWSQLLAGKTIVKKMNNIHFHIMRLLEKRAKGSIMGSNPGWSNFNFFQTLFFVLCSKAKINYIFTEIINCLFSISIAHFSLWEQPKTTCVKRYIKYRLANALWYGNKKNP